MSQALALPTRKAEDWRYADLPALAKIWPLPAPEAITVPAGGHFTRAIVQDAGGVSQITLTLEPRATAEIHILATGSAYGRIELAVTLQEGADFTLGGAQLGTGAANLEIITTVTHAGPNATSRQLVRTVLAGHATGTYLGKVAVARGANGTDASQSVRAMLLDRTATANARPELEIYADDVKCAHGCAVGELDANGLFYLESRGLPPADAKNLMLQAFVAEAFVDAADEDNLRALAQSALAGLLA